jgi:hypothetical protein
MIGEVRARTGAENFSLHHPLQNGSGAHPVSYPRGTRSFSVGVKRPGREADQSPTSRAEVKNAWSYTSTPPIRLNEAVPVKAQGQLYFYLLSKIYYSL